LPAGPQIPKADEKLVSHVIEEFSVVSVGGGVKGIR
jgi:hypothetical protein